MKASGVYSTAWAPLDEGRLSVTMTGPGSLLPRPQHALRVRAPAQAVQGDRWAREVAEEALEAVAVVRWHGDAGVEVESSGRAGAQGRADASWGAAGVRGGHAVFGAGRGAGQALKQLAGAGGVGVLGDDAAGEEADDVALDGVDGGLELGAGRGPRGHGARPRVGVGPGRPFGDEDGVRQFMLAAGAASSPACASALPRSGEGVPVGVDAEVTLEALEVKDARGLAGDALLGGE